MHPLCNLPVTTSVSCPEVIMLLQAKASAIQPASTGRTFWCSVPEVHTLCHPALRFPLWSANLQSQPCHAAWLILTSQHCIPSMLPIPLQKVDHAATSSAVQRWLSIWRMTAHPACRRSCAR